MLKTITSAIFNITVLTAAAVALHLMVTGHTRGLEGLLLGLGAIVTATIFGFRLADGYDGGRLSIWTGPLNSMRLTPMAGDRLHKGG